MKKHRRGSKIVEIVKQKLKCNKVTERYDRVPDSTSKIPHNSQQSVIENTVHNPEQLINNQQYINEPDESFHTAANDIAYEITIFASASSPQSTNDQTVTLTWDDIQDEILENALRPNNDLTLLNDDLYLTDSSDEYVPQDDAASSSDFSDNLKPTRTNPTTTHSNKNGGLLTDVFVSGSGELLEENPEADSTLISDVDSANSKRQRRKRNGKPAVPSEWKKNKRKYKRQHGEPYVSAKGALIPGKTLKDSKCMGRCIHQCTSKFTEEERLKIFSSFWEINSVEQKRLYIVSRIRREKTKNLKRSQSRKKLTNKYFLKKEGTNENIRVCQKFFVSTLNVSETFIRVCFKKVIDDNVVVGDKRGKHAPHNKKPKEIREHVRNHIKSFPRLPTPRGRKNAKKEYLARNLNLTKMYKLYRIKCDCEQRECVELAYYRSVFNKDFNIGFHRPGRDICDTCSSFEQMDEKEKKNQKELQEEHLRRTVASTQHREIAKLKAQLGDIHFVEYDMKAICDCPSSRPKHKIPVYNFTLLDFNKENRNVLCYCWHEGIARKGAAEIGSCLYKYLLSKADGKPVTFMSDTCASQCRNMYISSLLLYCIETLDIPEINQKYFEQGHSQMETDDIHTIIEKANKNTTVHSPSGLYNTIRKSLSKYPSNVYEMSIDDFIDIKYLKNIIVKNAKVDFRGDPVNWFSIRWLQYRKETPNNIYFKYELNDPEFNKIEVYRRGKRQQNCDDIVLLKKPHSEHSWTSLPY